MVQVLFIENPYLHTSLHTCAQCIYAVKLNDKILKLFRRVIYQ